MTRPFFFFFSSRRRHTRLTCDWSSDVCSSDLPRQSGTGVIRPVFKRRFPAEINQYTDNKYLGKHTHGKVTFPKSGPQRNCELHGSHGRNFATESRRLEDLSENVSGC